MYVGTDGIRSNGSGQFAGAYTTISGGLVRSNQVMTANGFFAGEAYISSSDGGTVGGNKFYCNNIPGKTTGAFSLQVYHDGETKYVGLNFQNGILVGISGF